MPTLPLLFGTFFTSHSMLSYASVVSLVAFGFSKDRPSDDSSKAPSKSESSAQILDHEDVAVSIQILERRPAGEVGILTGTPSGVRRTRIGSGPVACVGVAMTVSSFTPSRTGTITFR